MNLKQSEILLVALLVTSALIVVYWILHALKIKV